MIIKRDLNTGDRLSDEEITQIISERPCYAQITENMQYYAGDNTALATKILNKAAKGIKPNEKLPTPYASTLSDTASSYSFSNIEYIDKEGDEDLTNYLEELKDIFDYNDRDIKDLRLGLNQLAWGVGYAIHWVKSINGEKQYRFSPVDDPRNVIPIFNNSIEPELVAFIYTREMTDKDGIESTNVQVYYATEILTYEMRVDADNGTQTLTAPVDMPNDYGMPPLEYYFNDFDFTKNVSLFHKVKAYIDAVDCVMTGNWNEVEKHAEAILLAMKKFKPEDVDNMKSTRVLDNLDAEDLKNIRYLTKEVQFEYQEWFYQALVMEIHKHTHILDYQNPDAGYLAGESAKALIYRHTDMDTIARRNELLNRNGQYRRIRLLNAIRDIKEDVRGIEIKYNHTLPMDLKEKIEAVNAATFLSNKTKQEQSGFDPEKESARIEEEKSTVDLDNVGFEPEQV
jgi:SPP1 family phage portal protein